MKRSTTSCCQGQWDEVLIATCSRCVCDSVFCFIFSLRLFVMESDEEVDMEFSGSESDTSDTDSVSEATTDHESDSSDISLSSIRFWREIDVTAALPPAPPRFPFTGTPSDFTQNDSSDVMEYVNKIIDDELVNIVVTETNRYARDENIVGWKDTNSDEIRIFFSVILLQSIIKKPSYQMYWTKHPLLVTPIFRQLLSYKRFLILKKCLHFSDNSRYDPASHPQPKLNKIWPILEHLNNKFKILCTPERDVTIDESLMLYKGRLGWVQYLPLKRARFGIKTYMLCESKSGYVWSVTIYTGKDTKFDDEYNDLPQSSQIVMSLMKPLLNNGYCLTVDNFYSSPQLADLLIANKTDIYGTVRPSRKDMPPSFRSKKLKKGEVVAFQRGKVTAMRWKDKRDVSILTTIHNAEMKTVNKRGKHIIKPTAVISYNDTMGGVDKVDQHIANNPVTRKRGKKYYKKIFFHLLELTLWNAFVLYKKSGGIKNALDFRVAVIEKMTAEHHKEEFSSKAAGRPSTSTNPSRLTGRHFPSLIPATAKKQNPTRLCGMCSRVRDANGKKNRRESRYMCEDCGVALCVVPCFRAFHTATNI